MKEIVAKRLQYYLGNRKITIYEFAKMVNKNYSYVYKVVMNKYNYTPKMGMIELFAKALEVDPLDLLTPLPDEFDQEQK